MIIAFLPWLSSGRPVQTYQQHVAQSPDRHALHRHLLDLAAAVILALERMAPKPRHSQGDKLPLRKAFEIGCCQILAPDFRHFALRRHSLGGKLQRVDRRAATLFTFYLAVPTMLWGHRVRTLQEGRHAGRGSAHRHSHRLCRVLPGRLGGDPPVSQYRGALRAVPIRLVSYRRGNLPDRLALPGIRRSASARYSAPEPVRHIALGAIAPQIGRHSAPSTELGTIPRSASVSAVGDTPCNASTAPHLVGRSAKRLRRICRKELEHRQRERHGYQGPLASRLLADNLHQLTEAVDRGPPSS